MNELPLVARAALYKETTAIHSGTRSHTYQQLLDRSKILASALLDRNDCDDLREARVALLLPPGFDYLASQWAIWRAGGVVVPLCLSATEPEWEYALVDSSVDFVITTTELSSKIGSLLKRLGRGILNVDEISVSDRSHLPVVPLHRRAMILYTSGTTSKPKGVVTTHANIQAQIESLVSAWEWTSSDRIPLFLPLHHIHGIINVVSCALWSGALIEAYSSFDTATILDRIRNGAYTVFMAVPTIYVKLIQTLSAAEERDREDYAAGFAGLRLMVSGSAALPSSLHQRWRQLTGQSLLERYGMTEIGMALSNPYLGERRPGAVGIPLPGVEVRLRSESGKSVTSEHVPGEIQVRGPSVFAEYWNRPEITLGSFDEGWFRTGDMAVVEQGYYRIMGRLSVDIIKSGGYKLSALEIESTLLEHPSIQECAVIGIPDETWGEAVAAAVVLVEGSILDLTALRVWCRDRLSAYKIPKQLHVAASLPRNAMGKVTKPDVRNLFTTEIGFAP